MLSKPASLNSLEPQKDLTATTGQAELSDPLVLACSPRKNGNSDFAASYFGQHFNKHANQNPELLHLRDYPVLSCKSCGLCDHQSTAPCSLDLKKIKTIAKVENLAQFNSLPASSPIDNAPLLFDKLFAAPLLLISSPIYFYHVPTIFKALMDRSQYWWMRKLQNHPRFEKLKPNKPLYTILIAARPKGNKLFEGSLVSLKYFLNTFGFELKEPLLLNALDVQDALVSQEKYLAQIKAYAQNAALEYQNELNK